MTIHRLAHPLLSIPLVLLGCQSAEVDEIAAALETEQGGLDTSDEAPLFGDDEALTDALDPERAADDRIAADAEVASMEASPDAAAYAVAVSWGQIPGNPDNEVGHDWSGAFRVNRGAIVVRRILVFEDATDALVERTDRSLVAFSSVTRPHHDGLILTILDPEPASADPQVLQYQGRDGLVLELPVRALLGEPVRREIDEAGNAMVALAVARPLDPCAHGFLRGRWHQVDDTHGRLYGRVLDAAGEPIGHLRGLYGVRRDGQQVFFGKYIARDGRFRGLFGGVYGEGHFQGRWIDRAGDRGLLGGVYREAQRLDGTGGAFAGRWAETTCEAGELVPVDFPRPTSR